VVAPTSVLSNWQRELRLHAPSLRVRAFEGERDGVVENAGAGDLVLVSYGLLQREAERFAAKSFHTVVLDEAQSIKNAETQRAQAVYALDAAMVVALTGTPVENHLGELWALFHATTPALLGSFAQFKARFAGPIERDLDDQRRAVLARTVRPFLLRRTKAAVAPELPPRIEALRPVELAPHERAVYERTQKALAATLEGVLDDEGEGPSAQEKRMLVLTALTRLRLLCCHSELGADVEVDADVAEAGSKQRALVELLVEAKEAGHRVLVFSQFVKHLRLAQAAATRAGLSFLVLDGSTPASERGALVDRFSSGEGDCFFLSLKAGGVGLNLTAADTVVHLDPWWNPAVEDQATDRAHRIGQHKPVTVVRLVASDTIEERILALHEHKRALVDALLEGSDAAAKLSLQDLADLVRGVEYAVR
jgi:SNF2 family DNA or RNA helicase